jgi:ABC-2 type transport system permease protein
MRPFIVKAIIKRDFKETCRNPQTLIILGITIGINLFLSLAIGKTLWVMTFSMSLVMIGFTITSFMITEEKEKKTLEALLVSPASYHEILFGKLFLTFLITVFISYLLIFSLHHDEVSVMHTLLSIPLGALVICFFGVVVGLICQTQAMLSGIGTILMLILFLPELLASTNEYIGYLARALPTHHVIQVAGLGKEGFSLSIVKHYGVLILTLFTSTFWVASFLKTAALQEGIKWSYTRLNKITSFILLLTLIFSSLVFLPIKGEIVKSVDNSFFYMNSQYKFSFPYKSKEMSFKEYHFQDKFIVKFFLMDSPDDYLYITVKKKPRELTSKVNLSNILEKIKKNEGMNLKRAKDMSLNGLVMERFSYETKDGEYLYYIFNTEEYLYRIGIEAEKENKKIYGYLIQFLENQHQRIRILD